MDGYHDWIGTTPGDSRTQIEHTPTKRCPDHGRHPIAKCPEYQSVTDAELLRHTIQASGLTTRGFAKLLTRDERTVRRWLDGSSPIPKAVKEFLATYQPKEKAP